MYTCWGDLSKIIRLTTFAHGWVGGGGVQCWGLWCGGVGCEGYDDPLTTFWYFTCISGIIAWNVFSWFWNLSSHYFCKSSITFCWFVCWGLLYGVGVWKKLICVTPIPIPLTRPVRSWLPKFKVKASLLPSAIKVSSRIWVPWSLYKKIIEIY